MLHDIDSCKKLKGGEFKKQMPVLRTKLGELQRDCVDAKIPTIILFEGWEPATMARLINHLLIPLDPRGFDYYNIGPSIGDEAKHTFLWKFWIKTPPAGRIAVFDRSWYSAAVVRSIESDKDTSLIKDAKEILTFERQLTDGGFSIIKLFVHVGNENRKPTAEEKCGLVKDDLELIKRQKQYMPLIDRLITATDVSASPWTIIEAEDEEYAAIKVLKTVAARMEVSLDSKGSASDGGYYKAERSPLIAPPPQKTDESEYKEKLEKYQQRLKTMQMELYRQKRPLVIVFEGRDAAGKGGNILRLTQHLNPRTYSVVPIGAPNDVELAHHYLWRFYQGLPAKGHLTIFDRSWYGRVLVERVDNLTHEADWKRSYREINEFEKTLIDEETILLKFWLEISKEEQLKRFIERVDTPSKNWKITSDDWTAREKWDEYTAAIEEMIDRTSLPKAPWTIINADDKLSSRIRVQKAILDITEKNLDIK